MAKYLNLIGLQTLWNKIKAEFAAIGHTHSLSIGEDTGTAAITLAHNKKYKMTAGGSTFIFQTPTDNNSNTISSAYCETAAGTAAKTASCTNYTATPYTYLHVLIRYANTSAGALTLNVNGQGAKPIYINGAVSSSSNYTLPAGTYIAFYDGTNYWLRTDGKLQAEITGTAGFADATYVRSNQTGDGWFKIAEVKLAPRTNSDVTAIWDVALALAGGGIVYEKICLDVRFNSSGNGVVSRFVRSYESDWTSTVKFAVLVSGQGGSGNTQVQLWAWQTQAWRSISIRQSAGNNWSLAKYNNSGWTYYSGNTGGTSKPVADATNHISVTDSTNVYMRAASFISTGTLPVARGGTGITTSTNVNAVVIGNSTTATNAMQTVRTGNGAFYATAQDAKPQFGTLPAAQGGTGKTSAKDACNAFINALDTDSSTPVDADFYVSQYVSGGTTTTTYHRRPLIALWTYIKGKLTSVTGVNISGNAATASAAQSGSALETAINGKYAKPSGGIPKTDLASAVQISLGKADTALQSESDPVFSASPAAGITSGNITSWNGKANATSFYSAMVGTSSSVSNWVKIDWGSYRAGRAAIAVEYGCENGSSSGSYKIAFFKAANSNITNASYRVTSLGNKSNVPRVRYSGTAFYLGLPSNANLSWNVSIQIAADNAPTISQVASTDSGLSSATSKTPNSYAIETSSGYGGDILMGSDASNTLERRLSYMVELVLQDGGAAQSGWKLCVSDSVGSDDQTIYFT